MGQPNTSWRDATTGLLATLSTLSLSTVVYIGLDRLLSVYYLRRYKPTRKKLLTGLFCFCTLPFLTHAAVVGAVDGFLGRHAAKAAIRKSVAAVVFLSVGVMSLAYAAIVGLLREHAQHVTSSVRKNFLSNQSQAGKTAAIIIGTSVVVYFPTAIYAFAGDRAVPCCAAMTTILTVPVVNPIVYCFRNRTFLRHILVLVGIEDELGERTLTRTASITLEQNYSLKLDRKKMVAFINHNPGFPLSKV